MNNIKNNLNNTDVLLPNVNEIILQLNKRIIRLKEEKENSLELDEEMIYDEEIIKANALLIELKNSKQQYVDNDLTIVNTHSILELEYFKAKKYIETKMSNFQKILSEDILNYNNSVHKYNLFRNVVEGLY